MKSATRATLVLAALLASANAHGTLSLFKADGVEYYAPLSNEVADSPARMVTDVSPSTISSPNVACGPSAAKSATQIANVTAGSTVEFGWRSGSPPTPWPHVRGPVMTYMGKCDGSAKDCDGTNMQWFKIDQQGFNADGSWTMANYNQNKTTSTVVPAALQNGDYLIRHELIGLHVLPAEFYVSCIQVSVSGGSDTPNAIPASFTATFPGGYSPTDKGVTTDVFSQFVPADYQYPGPKLFFADSSSSSTDGSAPASTDSPASTTTSAPTSTPTKVKCKAKRSLRGSRMRLPRNH